MCSFGIFGFVEFLEFLESLELRPAHKQLFSGILYFCGFLTFLGAEPLLNVLKTTTKGRSLGGGYQILVTMYHIHICKYWRISYIHIYSACGRFYVETSTG